MRYCTTTLLLALPVLATQIASFSRPIVDDQVSPRDAQVPDTFKSVLTNWGHFGQTDFPHSTQPLATGPPAHLAQLPTDASGGVSVGPYDEILPPRAPKAFPINLNGTSVASVDWPPFFSTDEPVNDCGDTVAWNPIGDDGPDEGDCAALRDATDDNPGFWNVTGDPGRTYQYVLLASHKSCGFAVMPWSNLIDNL